MAKVESKGKTGFQTVSMREHKNSFDEHFIYTLKETKIEQTANNFSILLLL
jgi:hypothetical protein